MKKLNFGCGIKIKEGFVNVDLQKHKGVDKSFDFNKFPYPLKADSFELILVDNVLEHLEDPEKVIEELHRIAKNGCLIQIRVPYCKSILSFNDITHKHHFNRRAIEQIVRGHDSYSYEKKNKFELIKNELRPTRYGKMLPKFLRKYANYLFNEIHDMIEVELKVIK
ncbi:methyltransferase domain-containing protein [Candidatus Woesearchaeota archaeon]|nr:methyltransferase domain-containing protein [Candidatus Woesearchaeota archaeon]MBT4368845.1 methyltransferase domain-containing protein [Candidatus Woesearchaeota archaeon]MBT4712134.1 methyltransferase domain-containing protein [Candidatus Woesearchaeota archaeon]MBT6639118.1 methyltransferase domain-containing protein [Candidatus Woesearchaeota archaeon]MBT7134318.1 methyltransferase domain-containing protein [Candidatus Woesearchaeota archaeon]